MAYQSNGQLSGARNQALKTAFSYVGDPYVLGGTSHQGIDCSGLVMAVYDQFGFGRYLDSHLAGHQAAAIPGVRTAVSNLRPGDLVAWRDGSHIAIYAGNGMIVSAADYGEGVKYQPVWGNVFGIQLRLPGE
jgi:cell wall-associated NlpC family hydrolase